MNTWANEWMMLNPRCCWTFVGYLFQPSRALWCSASLLISSASAFWEEATPLIRRLTEWIPKNQTPLRGEGPARLAVTHRAQQEAAARVTAAKCADLSAVTHFTDMKRREAEFIHVSVVLDFYGVYNKCFRGSVLLFFFSLICTKCLKRHSRGKWSWK